MVTTVLSIIIILLIIFGAMYGLKSYNPHTDFDTWCLDVKLQLSLRGMHEDVREFRSRDWIDDWYEGKTPKKAVEKRHGTN